MNRILKDYIPMVEPMDLGETSKDFKKKWDSKLKISDVEALTMLR